MKMILNYQQSELEEYIDYYALPIKKDKDIWNDFYHSNYIYLINTCLNGKDNLVHYFKNDFGMNINITNRNGETPLFYACKSRNVEVLKYLIEQGANINIKSKKGETPIFYGFWSGNEYMVDYLIKQGADINEESLEGMKFQ